MVIQASLQMAIGTTIERLYRENRIKPLYDKKTGELAGVYIGMIPELGYETIVNDPALHAAAGPRATRMLDKESFVEDFIRYSAHKVGAKKEQAKYASQGGPRKTEETENHIKVTWLQDKDPSSLVTRPSGFTGPLFILGSAAFTIFFLYLHFFHTAILTTGEENTWLYLALCCFAGVLFGVYRLMRDSTFLKKIKSHENGDE